jgi:catechol 2,3-dioxygenase-like lactoylglutathione lyase family enzyme
MFRSTQSFSSFAVNDTATAREFYGETLGLDVAAATPNPHGPLWLQLGGERGILIYPKSEHVPATFTVLNLSVEDIDQAVDELHARGVKVERYDGYDTDVKGIFREPGRSIAWFKDPAGNGLCVVEEETPPA